MQDEQPKVVPHRNNLKGEPLFVKATIADQNARPGYVRQWLSTNKQHPQYYKKYIVSQTVGDVAIGYCQAEPWTIVDRKDAKPGRKKDDDTSGVESAQTHGDLILVETTEENAAIFRKADKLRTQSRERALATGERETITAQDGAGRAHYQARVGVGTADDARAILEQ